MRKGSLRVVGKFMREKDEEDLRRDVYGDSFS